MPLSASQRTMKIISRRRYLGAPSAATRFVAGQLCATDSYARTARSDALSSESGTGDQPYRQPGSESVGRRQHQASFGGHGHVGRFRAANAGSDGEGRTRQPAVGGDGPGETAEQDTGVGEGLGRTSQFPSSISVARTARPFLLRRVQDATDRAGGRRAPAPFSE